MSTEPEVVSRESLANLESDFGRETAELVVQTFLDTLPERLELVEGPDETLARRTAHTIKGGALMLGAQAAAEAAKTMELTGTGAAAVRVECERAAEALRAWLAG